MQRENQGSNFRTRTESQTEILALAQVGYVAYQLQHKTILLAQDGFVAYQQQHNAKLNLQ